MIYLEHEPSELTRPYIKNIVYYQDYKAKHKIERLLPDCCSALVIDLEDGEKAIYDNTHLKPVQLCKGAWFSGLQSEFISIDSGRESKMIVVSFHPGGAYKFTNTNQSGFHNRVVDASKAFGSDINILRKELKNTHDHTQLQTIVECWFDSRHFELPFSYQVIFDTLRSINSGKKSVEELVAHSGYSHKQFVHLFKTYIGTTPKLLQRLVRFNNILTQCHQEIAIDWTKEAYDCGYHDQAHFIRDFQRFSGLNPKDYLKNQGQWANYIPIR